MLEIPACTFLVILPNDYSTEDKMVDWVADNIMHPYWLVDVTNAIFVAIYGAEAAESINKMGPHTAWCFSDFEEALLFELRWK